MWDLINSQSQSTKSKRCNVRADFLAVISCLYLQGKRNSIEERKDQLLKTIDSGFDYVKEKKEKGVTSLCHLIKYKQSNKDGINAVINGLRFLWNNKDISQNKENTPLMCTFAISGQGKTEL
jgi:hypothetical protein